MRLLAVSAALAVAVALARRRWFIVRVVGHSMSPTYADGARLLFRRAGSDEFSTTDCVAFVPPGFGVPATADATRPQLLVKRVAAIAGDPVPPAFRVAARVADAVVPPGCLVVSGDNPASLDSRHFGYLPTVNVVGVAVRNRRPPAGA